MIILDNDPKIAVQSLIKSDILKYYNIFYKHFNELYINPEVAIKTGRKNNYIYKHKTTLFNKSTFLYYWNIFLELEKAVNEIYGSSELINREFTDDFMKKLSTVFKNSEIILYTKEDYCKYKNFLDSNNDTQDYIILNNRLFYILQEYQVNDFYYDVPTWYTFSRKIILEKYSLKERKHIKIIQENNKIKYYIADYQNNWIELRDISENTQSFIKSILFR